MPQLNSLAIPPLPRGLQQLPGQHSLDILSERIRIPFNHPLNELGQVASFHRLASHSQMMEEIVDQILVFRAQSCKRLSHWVRLPNK